ncbi:MAG: Trk system potassium transporter TrkA [Planctomycetota bacterium]|nr:MAG: Trk system potassium transporter TrkA [Planctomycetota bacterium]
MRIVIGGEGEVAYRLAQALMEEHEVVLICSDDLREARLERLDVEIVPGSLTAGESLRNAQIDRSAVFIACSQSDERNMVGCVVAKRLGVPRTICFLFRRSFQSSQDETDDLAESLGIDTVVRPPERLAEEILHVVSVPGALDVRHFAQGRVRLVRHPVEEGARITKAPLKEVDLPKGVVLVKVIREEKVIIPVGDTQLRNGDQVVAMGNLVGINRLLFRFLRPRSRKADPRRATIIGGGLVGLAIAKDLEAAGWTLKVVEANSKRAEEISSQLQALVLQGDGADPTLLEEEGVYRDSVLIAVTSNDEKNLLISLLGKHMGIPRTITRADSLVNEILFEKVGVDVVRSSQGAAISAVVRNVSAGGAENVAELEHGDAVVMDLAIPEDHQACELFKLQPPSSARIGAILRGRSVIIPHGLDVVKAGDRILVFCRREEETGVREYFENLGEG